MSIMYRLHALFVRWGVLAVSLLMLALAAFCASPSSAYAEIAAGEGDSAIIEEQAYTPDERSLASNDELFSGYLYNRFHKDTSVELQGDQGLTALSGIDLEIYKSLKAQIAAVAAGEESSTAFEVFLDDQMDWDIDLRGILDALLADCPYELYWYDKTSTTWMTHSYTDSGHSVTISFVVSSDYRGDSDYAADTSKTSAASNAVAAAKSIVSAAEGKPDYDKLVYYRDAICDLVSYNSAAAEGDSVAYGDPWQIIYVFDGDTSTNVVCEGYAKAFQYLCDLSVFSNDITCYSVTGVNGEGGGHEWNVVSVNGDSYLVDVNGCDEEQLVAERGELFLVGCSSGSWDTQYALTTSYAECEYAYYDSTKSLFGESILTLATSDLDPSTMVDAPVSTSLIGATLTLSDVVGLVYNGSEQEPPVTVVLDGITLQEDTDYSVAYSNNVNAGTATVAVTGMGNYVGAVTTDFAISKAKLTATYADEAIAYGATPKLAVEVTGFVNGETALTASGYTAPTVQAPATLEAGQSYEIVPLSGKADNYEFTYVAGTLTVGENQADSGSDDFGQASEMQSMHRLYNPNSGEHFYTASSSEKDGLVKVGWNYEGVGWTAPVTSNTPVYRMYNPNPSPKTGSGEHHYTTSAVEKEMLEAAGWQYEGIGWYSDDNEEIPLYRLYNPNEFNNNHHYTTSADERDNLLSLGWKDEGIAWYGA